MEFDLNPNGAFDTIDLVPEQFRPIYAEDPADKKFKISSTMKSIAEAITGLNGALKNERKISTALKGQKDVAAVIKETLGFDTIDEAKARLDELNGIIAEKSKVDPAKIKADIEKTFDTERQNLKGANAKMQGTLEKYLVNADATAALANAKGNVKLLLPIIQGQTVVVADGDEYVVRIKDPTGDYRGNGAGGFMTVADLVKEMKSSTDYGVAFESDAAKGGGKPLGQQRTQQTQQRTQQQDRADRTPAQMIADGLKARRI